MDESSPFPDCARATSANATKNSRLDTRGLELTKLTIWYSANQRIERTACEKKTSTLSMVVAGSAEDARTRDNALTETSPVLEVSMAAKALRYASGTVASAGKRELRSARAGINTPYYL